jgi:hypothetical protein
MAFFFLCIISFYVFLYNKTQKKFIVLAHQKIMDHEKDVSGYRIALRNICSGPN